jgi:type I restriction enzyme R subunit
VDELTRDRSAMSLEAANREVYLLLKEGIKVSVPDRERGGQKTERLRVVDWEQPANNDFLLVSQFSVTGALYTCRPDLVGFVNGLPLVVIELKKPGVPARAAFDENLTHYKQQIPALFWLTRCSSPRTARTVASARSRRIGSGSSIGNASSARTSRAGCRWR